MIDKKKSFNGSYLLGWLSSFGPVFDYNLKHSDLPEQRHIVYVDDEIFEWQNLSLPIELKRMPDFFLQTPHVFITKIRWIHEYLTKHGAQSIFFPWFQIVDHAISLHFLGYDKHLAYPTADQGNFFCLNRCHRPHRQDIVMYLKKHNLLAKGRVTYREIDLNIPELYSGDDISHYQPENWGHERHKMEHQEVFISSTVENFIKINCHYQQPINISAETVTAFEFFPTEKSMLAFFTKRLPLICAYKDRVKQIREEGFDLFDWLLDHSYDGGEDYDARMKAMIDKNLCVLQEPINVDNRIKDALKYNYNHITGNWLESKLKDLEKQLMNCLLT